jgi:hypothetical protein
VRIYGICACLYSVKVENKMIKRKQISKKTKESGMLKILQRFGPQLKNLP